MFGPHGRFDHVAAVAACLVSCMLLGCSNPIPRQDPHFSAGTITIVDDGVQPGPDLVLPAFGTVVWRNALRGEGRTLDIKVSRPFDPSEGCATTLNFAAAGKDAAAASLRGPGLAALCFHDAGTFEWVAKSGSKEWHGKVVVEAK